MLVRPHCACQPEAGLHFIVNQQRLVLVRDTSQPLMKLRTKMVIAALTLDRLDQDRGDIARVALEGFPDLAFAFLFTLDYICERSCGDRKMKLRVRHARPVEF